MKYILTINFIFIYIGGFAQCEGFSNHPKGKAHAKSLMKYQDFIASKDYTKALPQWQELYEYCKGANPNILRDGVIMHKHFAKNAIDTTTKRRHLQTVSKLYLEQIQCYGHLIRQSTFKPWAGIYHYHLGRNYYKLQDYEKAFDAFQKSLAIDSFHIHFGLLYPFAKSTLEVYNLRKIDEQEVQNIRQVLIEIVDSNQRGYSWEEVDIYKKRCEKAWTSAVYNSRFGKRALNCDFFANAIKALYIEDSCSRHHEYLNVGSFLFLTQIPCGDSTMIHQELITKYSDVPVIDRTLFHPDNFFAANFAMRQGFYDCAKKHYLEGVYDEEYNKYSRYKAAVRIGLVSQMNEEWDDALKFYKYATTLNAKTGKPYIKIAILYLRSNKDCSDFDRKLVANIGLDYFEKAKQFEDTKDRALKKIKLYNKFLPTKEEFLAKYPNYTKTTMEVGCELKKEVVLRFRE
jgi:tetratricopeptide (TPR) repeat protein